MHFASAYKQRIAGRNGTCLTKMQKLGAPAHDEVELVLPVRLLHIAMLRRKQLDLHAAVSKSFDEARPVGCALNAREQLVKLGAHRG
jgi:hypothetical protein